MILITSWNICKNHFSKIGSYGNTGLEVSGIAVWKAKLLKLTIYGECTPTLRTFFISDLVLKDMK